MNNYGKAKQRHLDGANNASAPPVDQNYTASGGGYKQKSDIAIARKFMRQGLASATKQ